MAAAAFGQAYLAETLRRLLDARLVDQVVSADPAAGLELSVTVPGGDFWEVLSVMTVLVTDANVAARAPVLILDDGTTVRARFGVGGTQAATSATTYQWGVGLPSLGTTAVIAQGGLLNPGFILPAGWRLRTSTTNLQVGDDYTAAQILLRRPAPDRLAQLASLVESELRETGHLGQYLD